MQFLLDAQLSRRLVRHLEQSGHGASHVFDHLDPNAEDLTIAALANRLGLSVMTKDADFAQPARRGALQQPLVWLRFPNLKDDLLLARIDQSLPKIVSAARRELPIMEVL